MSITKLVLPALLFVSLVAGDAFVPGQQYTYHYTGKIGNAIPGVQRHYSGLALDYRIIIQARSDHLVFKIKDVKTDKVNKQVNTLDDYVFDFKPSVEYAEHLTKPFKVYYEEGMVKKFYIEREEPEWSLNIKKAILTTFQVNLRQFNPMRIQKGNYLVKPDPSANYFRVMEDGIGGECETMYNIMSHPDVETPYNNNVLNVSKTRNYRNCKNRPIEIYSNIDRTKNINCGPEVEKHRNLHSFDETYYHIRGDRYHFLIERAHSESEHIYTPFTTNGQSMISAANQTIVLEDVKPTPQIITPDSDLIGVYSLTYKFPSKLQFRDLVDLKKPHTIYVNHNHEADVGVIGTLFENIAKSYNNLNIEENLSQNYTAKYYELVRHFTTLSYDNINRIYIQYAAHDFTRATQEQKAKIRLFLNVLADVGTNPAYSFVKYLITTKRIEPTQATTFFNFLAYSVKEPTETLLDDIFRLCSHSEVSQVKSVRKACYLAFATIVNEHCVRKTDKRFVTDSYERSCTPEITEKYVNYIHQKYGQSYTPAEKTTFLSALGSLGSQKVIDYLKPVIQGHTSDSIHVRQEATFALFELAPHYPEEVISVTSPVLFNTTEDHEIRIAAFTVMISAQPSLYHFHEISKVMKYEKNYHVQNYIYTALEYLSNSTHPEHVKVAESAKIVFETLKASNFTPVYSPNYSFRYTSSGYNPKYNYGGYTTLSYIANNVSYIPRAVYLRVNDYIGGFSTVPLEIGFRSQGLDKIVDKIFGPEGIFYKKKSVFDVLSRKPRSIDNVQKELKEIKDALNLSPREYEPIVGSLIFKRHGSVLNFLNFDEDTFKNFLTTDTFQITDMFAYLKQGFEYHHQIYTMAIDITHQIPTEVGLPLLLEIKFPTQNSINIDEVKFSVEPSVFAKDRGSKAPIKVQLFGKGRVTTDTVRLFTFSILSPFEKLKYGAGFEERELWNIPLQGKIVYDVAEAKLTTEYEPIHEKLYHMSFEPMTFIDSYTNQVSLQGEKSYIPIGIHKYQHHTKNDYGHETFGVGIQNDFEYYGFHYDTPAFMDMLSEHDWRSLLYYTWLNPKFVPFKYSRKITPATTRQTKKIQTTFEFKRSTLVNEQAYTSVIAVKDQEFETYTNSPLSHKPQTYSVVAVIKGTGDVERTLETELVYQWSHDNLFHRYGIYAKRNAFTTSETPVKYCLNAKIRLPTREWQKIISLNTQQLTTLVKSKVEIGWGKDCITDKKIVVDMESDRTEQQVNYEREIATLRSHYASKSYPYHEAYPHPPTGSYNPYADLYYKCVHQKSHGFFMNQDCLKYVQKVTELRKFSHVITYKNIPETFSNYTMKAVGLFNHKYYNHLDYYFSPAINRVEGRITIKANASVHHPVFDVEVKMPKANFNYERIYVPIFYPMSTLYTYAVTNGYYQNYLTNYKHVTYSACTLDKYVQTFTNSTYEAPWTNCYHVVAKDCSEHDRYTVLASKPAPTSHYKNIKVLLKEYSIELLPYGGAIKVRVNGKAVQVRPTNPHFQVNEVDGQKYAEFIIRVVDGLYFIDAPQTGVYVQFDGKNAAVFLSNYYRGKQCGLCGNMNGRNDHTQYAGPEKCYYTNTTAFTHSYAIPTTQCKVPVFEKSTVCNINPVQNTYPEEVCTPMRNRIIYGEDFDRQVCFSTKPLPECNKRCRATRMLTKSVEFHCLSTRDDYAQRLIGLRDRRVLYELNNKQGDKMAEIQYPENCVSEYQY